MRVIALTFALTAACAVPAFAQTAPTPPPPTAPASQQVPEAQTTATPAAAPGETAPVMLRHSINFGDRGCHGGVTPTS